jgi:hypothetical protein
MVLLFESGGIDRFFDLGSRSSNLKLTTTDITHKPTGYKFAPYPGDPMSGTVDKGQLGDKFETGEDFVRLSSKGWPEGFGRIMRAAAAP